VVSRSRNSIMHHLSVWNFGTSTCFCTSTEVCRQHLAVFVHNTNSYCITYIHCAAFAAVSALFLSSSVDFTFLLTCKICEVTKVMVLNRL